LILHFVTVAEDKEDCYKQGDTFDDNGVAVKRTAPPEKARQNDALIAGAWRGHSSWHRLPNSSTFSQKVEAALEIVMGHVSAA